MLNYDEVKAYLKDNEITLTIKWSEETGGCFLVTSNNSAYTDLEVGDALEAVVYDEVRYQIAADDRINGQMAEAKKALKC